MLVVDGVELAMVDEVPDVRRFDNGHAVVLEQGSNSGDHALGVGYVPQDVVGVNHISTFRVCGERVGQFAAKEALVNRHSRLAGGRRGPGCWIDAEHWDAALDII